MAQATRSRTRRARPETLKSFNPATGQIQGEIVPNTPGEVRDAVTHARKAAPEWASLPAKARARMMREVRHRIYELLDDIVQTVADENGKPQAEALSNDILPTVLTLRYYERIAPRALRPQKVGRLSGPILARASSHIEWRPFGVVGCISPWNYPFWLGLQGVIPALFAGNAVVLKPSEVTPGVGERIREVFEPLPAGVATVVQGGAEVGAALVDAPCDKLCFIGSPRTGRRIAEAASKHLTPVVMELGGTDPAIVCSDADLDMASSGILWGAFQNAGQTCCSIERAYVVESVADRFEERLLHKLGKVRFGAEDNEIGAITFAPQLDIVRRHVDDAVAKGAKVLAGGPRAAKRGRKGGQWYPPTVLGGVTTEMSVLQEETFGPVLPIIRVRDEEEAVQRANEEGFNLTSSVWTADKARGQRLASKIKAGSVSINDHISLANLPWASWGGVGESGYGRLNGVVGLREFTVPVNVGRALFPSMKGALWYPYDRASQETLRGAVAALAAPRRSQRIKGALKALKNAGSSLKNKL
ncbi:MAG: aldehyde dehydrogenase family protein [Actinomycetota bacterium]